MEKFKSIDDFCASNNIERADLSDYILRTAIDLGCNCKENFCGETEVTENAFMTLEWFNQILEKVE